MVSTLELRCDFKIHLTSLWCPVSTMSKRRYDNLAMIKTLLLGMIRMFTQKIFFSFSFPSFHEAEKLVLSSGSCKTSPEQPFSFHPQLSFQVFFSWPAAIFWLNVTKYYAAQCMSDLGRVTKSRKVFKHIYNFYCQYAIPPVSAEYVIRTVP